MSHLIFGAALLLGPERNRIKEPQCGVCCFQMRDNEGGDSDFEEALMGMSPDTGFVSPKLIHEFQASRFAPPTPLPPDQAAAFRRSYDWQGTVMITNTTHQ